MAVSLVEPERLSSDALDAVERVMMASRLSFERMGDEDITGSLAGGWCDYQLWFAYRADLDVLHFASGFDMGIPDDRRPAVGTLVNLINEASCGSATSISGPRKAGRRGATRSCCAAPGAWRTPRSSRW